MLNLRQVTSPRNKPLRSIPEKPAPWSMKESGPLLVFLKNVFRLTLRVTAIYLNLSLRRHSTKCHTPRSVQKRLTAGLAQPSVSNNTYEND